MLDRSKNLAEVVQHSQQGFVWDVVVIGGGATGLGSALDAASRGLSVLLLEGHDFAKGTSSRATKLAHGGVRYLAQGNISLVREALAERGRMLRNAPNLVKPLAFVIPVRNWFQKLFYWVGLKAYDLLAGKLGVGATTLMSRQAVLNALPTIATEGLAGGVRYFDAQFDDARLAIALMKTLHARGGVALNYCKVTGFEKAGGRIEAVKARCGLTGQEITCKARAVVNATGVWVDELRQMDDPAAHKILRPSQGVHVVVDAKFYPAQQALLVPKTSDGRVLFVVPWLGKTLIGTTDTPREDTPLEPADLPGEVDFILKTAGQYLAKAPTAADVRSVFAGLRPLVSSGSSKNTKSISREHTILIEPSGLVTITGGKWTTYRSMAQEVINLVCKQHGWANKQSCTATMRLDDEPAPAAVGPAGQPLDKRLQLTRADVEHAVRHEMAMTIEDVLARRSRALFLDSAAAVACIPVVREVLTQQLGLGPAVLDEQEQEFTALARQYSAQAKPGAVN